MTTGEKIRKLRKRNGRSQELARRLGLTPAGRLLLGNGTWSCLRLRRFSGSV